jgi:hypothetical protein
VFGCGQAAEKELWAFPSNIDSESASKAQVRSRKSAMIIRLLRVHDMLQSFPKTSADAE